MQNADRPNDVDRKPCARNASSAEQLGHILIGGRGSLNTQNLVSVQHLCTWQRAEW
jgi:hypothetical protein